MTALQDVHTVTREALGMAFRVVVDASGTFDNYLDKDGYTVVEGGALRVDTGDGKRITYSAVGWIKVEEDSPKKQGPVIDRFMDD